VTGVVWKESFPRILIPIPVTCIGMRNGGMLEQIMILDGDISNQNQKDLEKIVLDDGIWNISSQGLRAIVPLKHVSMIVLFWYRFNEEDLKRRRENPHAHARAKLNEHQKDYIFEKDTLKL
jgi:hypothetical protein